MNGPSGVSAGCGERCYFVFKKSPQAQLPGVQTLQTQKEVGRGKKKTAGCLQRRTFCSEKITIADHGDYRNLSRFQD